MGYHKKHYTMAFEILNARKVKNRALTDKRTAEIYEKFPQYKEYNYALSKVGFNIASLILNGENIGENLKKLEAENLNTQKKMAQILLSANYPENYLDEIYTCPKCKDTGNTGTKWCECFDKILKNIAVNELNSTSPLKLCSFSGFDLSRYPTMANKGMSINPYDIMVHNYNFCKNYADNFHLPYNGIFMRGATGLGKTHLSLAIANEVTGKGYSVVYGSAPDLLRKIEKQRFGQNNDETLELTECCDLLILDDLGKEYKTDFYTSVVYNLLNSRINKRLPVIISTNLSYKEVRDRYDDSIVSRITTYEDMPFYGKDIRQQ